MTQDLQTLGQAVWLLLFAEVVATPAWPVLPHK